MFYDFNDLLIRKNFTTHEIPQTSAIMADDHNQQQMKVESNVDKVKAKAKEVA